MESKRKNPTTAGVPQGSAALLSKSPVSFVCALGPNLTTSTAQLSTKGKCAGFMEKIKISANKLAEFISAKTPGRRKTIVRQLIHSKNSDKGYAPFYMSFGAPAKEYLFGGAVDASILVEATRELLQRGGGKWHQIDSRITTEALKSLARMSAELRALNVEFRPRAARAIARLQFPGVTVTITPDLLFHGERNGVPLVGSLRFYLAKESSYHLGSRAAELVATMEYLWLLQSSTGERTTDTSLCLVLECLQRRITTAPSDVTANIAAIEAGCQQLVAMWQLLSSQEAA